MCRNIKPLFNFEPPATHDEMHDAALQFVRKISGTARPSRKNQEAFDRAVRSVAAAVHQLFHDMETTGQPRNREIEAEKAKARSALRFA